jgi:Domain of unknown function DUF29
MLPVHGDAWYPQVMKQSPQFKNLRAAQEKPSRETDLYAWLSQQADELRSRQPDFIDWSELAEELDELVALAKKETVSRLRTVLVHLIKWKYQTARRDQRSWKTTIVRERLDLALLLDSKNLRNYLVDKGYALAYRQARQLAGSEMQLARNTWERLFPEACEWDFDTTLNDEFFPSPVAESNGHSR